ncbi:hypothetical protein EMPS_07793 [Entomortierella parvispora]|uniref:Uncharacterized protein n=1 Tax=Entomortierella parvispora TaxID=205924 RepID=A0A9P3HET7_9FUNG|nr:hypothetical protein EMPS_07793 [Entomortierella parvispora]
MLLQDFIKATLPPLSYKENPQQDFHNRGSAMDNGFPSFLQFAEAGRLNRIEFGSVMGKKRDSMLGRPRKQGTDGPQARLSLSVVPSLWSLQIHIVYM